jgi:hypothetical protein
MRPLPEMDVLKLSSNSFLLRLRRRVDQSFTNGTNDEYGSFTHVASLAQKEKLHYGSFTNGTNDEYRSFTHIAC